MSNITEFKQMILIEDGKITFSNFKKLKTQVTKLSTKIKKIEVNEESIKEVKKELATISADVKALETVKIEIKKQILKPYEEFEGQIKELVSIIKTADEIVRNQVREMEEKDRAQKEQDIIELWNKRNQQYKFAWLSPEDFIKAEYMNKTYSINKTEKEMVEWFEMIEKDLQVIKTLDNNAAILLEYKKTKNLAASISHVKSKLEELEEIKRSSKIEVENAKTEPVKVEGPKEFIIVLSNYDEFKKLLDYAQKQNMSYKIKN